MEFELQLAPITEILKFDFNADGNDDVLLAGNYFGVIPFQGRFDSFSGAIIQSSGEYIPPKQVGIDLSQKSVRGLNIISFKGQNYLLVTINNDKIEIYKTQN
jgi:hypothetical protein